ncbi:hypothetical protein [Methylosinus sp. R-45379]|uniref:hypothetical protein n=1 Tax=Methylosinus sp. R-45379 TaxID=980563 RepID=UPI0012ED9E7D|nr:hypothetical protein [Methylosinus sp. R-45379]
MNAPYERGRAGRDTASENVSENLDKKKRHRPPFVCSRLHQSRFASEAFVANRCAPILARLCANVAERRCSAANVELFVRQNDSLDRIGNFDPLDRRAPKRLESRKGLTAQS